MITTVALIIFLLLIVWLVFCVRSIIFKPKISSFATFIGILTLMFFVYFFITVSTEHIYIPPTDITKTITPTGINYSWMYREDHLNIILNCYYDVEKHKDKECGIIMLNERKIGNVNLYRFDKLVCDGKEYEVSTFCKNELRR